MAKILVVLVALFCLISVTQQEDHKKLDLDKPYDQQLAEAQFFTGRYVFNIDEKKVTGLKSEKWFFFVELEPNEEKQWVSTSIELSVGKKGNENSTPVKSCESITGGTDSCFLTSKQFNYMTEEVHVRVRCRGECKFKLSGEVSTPYKLTPGEKVKMDFENTAYSKVFTLDTSKSENFDQLRIILRPEGFLQFPAPIGLYINQDQSLPTRDRHDLKGMTLWDNGQGIFLEQPDASGVFTILVEGPERNVLVLETQLISFKKTNDLVANLPYFDYLGEGSSKFYKAKVDPKKGTCLQLTTFSGSLKLKGIYDADLQLIDEEFSPLYRSFGELQYQISPDFFKQNQEDFSINEFIVFEIEGVKETTFLLESYQLISGIAHLHPERNRYVELPGEQYSQYFIDIVELNTVEFKQAEFQIILTTEETKKMDVRFFNCKKDHGKDCELKSSEIKASKLNNADIVELQTNFIVENLMDGVKIYKFNIKSKDFRKVGNDTKRFILTVLIQNQEKDEQLYTIQYINYGRNYYLKEGEVKTDRISIDESKYYAFTSTNPEVKEIRFHVMEISGRVFMEGYQADPRHSDMEGKEIMDYHNSVRFTKVEANQTIYLKITGKQAAYYSVQLQLLKENERNWWNRTHPSKGKGYNEIILVEDIPYEFNIQPHEKVVYQLHSKKEDFVMEISSLLPLELCMTEELTKPPFLPNCDETKNLTKNMILDVHLDKGKIGNIGVQNPNDKSVKFNIKFTTNSGSATNDSSKPDPRCLPGMMGKVVKQNFKKETASCFQYNLSKIEDIEIMVDVISDEYQKVNTLVEINGVERVEVIGTTHLFKKAQLAKACGNIAANSCQIKVFVSSHVDTQIVYALQYMTDDIFLLDGIANAISGDKDRRTFVYELHNKVNTTIILENKNGFFKFYGRVVQAIDYWSSKTTFPTPTDNTIVSTNPFYYSHHISVLSQNEIKKTKCNQCLLLITVEKEKDNLDHEKSKFIIECTQEDRFLKENSPVASYLGYRSFAFYEFYNSKQGTILVTVNSQNQDCAKIYMKKGVQSRATGSDYDKKSVKGNLILQQAEIGNYAITLEATNDCHYSIDVTTSTTNLFTSIERGLYTDVNLEKGENKKFIYQNEWNETIKFLTLHQNGEMLLQVKAYPTVKQLLTDSSKKIKYQWSGKDFLKIETKDSNFCVNCVYLISVSTERQTKSSIMIASKDSQFPIMMDSTIKDELKKGEVEKLRIFTDKIAQFEINVQYGSINITVIGSYNNEIQFTKVYKASQSSQYENISSAGSGSGKSDYTFMKFNKIIIKAEEDSGFTFGMISDKNESKRGQKVKLGIAEYITLDKNKRECLKGIIDDNSEQFLISITGEKQLDLMNNLEISCEIDKKALELSKNIAKNEMIVTIGNPPKNVPVQYEFCLKSNANVFLTFIQSSQLNYFPQKNTLMVVKAMNLSFYTEGKSLVEINECTSRAITSISQSFNQVSSMSSDIKQVRKANNIIEFTFYGPVFIHVEAASATISWRKKDELTGQGYGYDEYGTSKIRIDKTSGFLSVEVFPLKQLVSKPQVTFEYVNYTSYLAEEEMGLYDAINCHNGTYLTEAIATNSETKSIIIRFNIETILAKFGKKKYFLAGVLANAKSKLKDDGNYRFIYPYQQVLISMLKSQKESDITKEPVDNIKPTPNEQTSSTFNEFVTYLGLGLLILVVGILVYRKWIRNILKRRRRERLAEQGTGEVRYQEFTSYT